jgi:hypothetical protein
LIAGSEEMKEEVNVAGCGRENDLIAFLYDELDLGERGGFRSHAQQCQSCNAELTAFTNIRESVVAWRNEALVGVTSPAVPASAMVGADRAKPSALTALREFFKLSPLWMKGAVVFASLLFCLFAVLAAARLRDTPPPTIADNPNVKKYSEQELNAAIDRRLQDHVQRIKNSPTTEPPPVAISSAHTPRNSVAKRGGEVASTNSQPKARRPLSKDERQQLAADLRLIEDPTDGQIELLDDRINQ